MVVVGGENSMGVWVCVVCVCAGGGGGYRGAQHLEGQGPQVKGELVDNRLEHVCSAVA